MDLCMLTAQPTAEYISAEYAQLIVDVSNLEFGLDCDQIYLY